MKYLFVIMFIMVGPTLLEAQQLKSDYYSRAGSGAYPSSIEFQRFYRDLK